MSDEADDLRREVAALSEALTIWCCTCKKTPAVVELVWSDRESTHCAEHLPEAVLNIVLDHSYDRTDIDPIVYFAKQHPALGLPLPQDFSARVDAMCRIARGYLDRIAARDHWLNHTVELTEAQCSELLSLLRA